MAKVVGIGAMVFDILMTIDSFPREDTKLRGEETKFQCGGPCATGLVAISKLGESACYMGTVGDDMYGSFVRGELERYGVSTTCVKVNPGLTFHSVVLLNLSNGSRTCVWNRGQAAAPMAEDVDLEILKGAQYLHLDGNQLDCALYAAKKAHEFGVTVSLDAGGIYPGIEELLPLVDVLIPSEEFARKITGCDRAEDAAQVLEEKYRPRILVITQGSKGGFIWERGRAVRYPVLPVKVIDSNGAGDTFHGAFLAARLKGMGIYDACSFDSAASALKCTRFGAQAGIPGYEEVLDFMKNHEGVIVDG